MDRRLVEFCLSLPWQLQTESGWTKLILRRAVEPLLPAQVVWRRDKDGLGGYFNLLLLRARTDYFLELLHEEEPNLRSYVDTSKLFRLWQEYLQSGNDRHMGSLWYTTGLALWLRHQRADRLTFLPSSPDPT